MRRVKRFSLYVGIVLLLCIFAAVGIRALLPHTDILKQSIEAALEKATNQKVSLGNVHLTHSFSRLIDVTLEDLVITSADGNTLASVRRVNLQPALMSLLRLHVTISAITMEGLSSSISLGSDGGDTSLFLPIPLPGQSGQAVSESEPQKTTHVLSQDDKKQEPEPAAGRTITWGVGIVRLLDGRLDVVGVQGKDPLLSISKLSGDLRKEPGENTYSYRLEAALQAGSKNTGMVKSTGMLKGDENWSRLDAASIDVKGRALDLALMDVYVPNSILSFSDLQAEKCDVRVVFERGKPIRASMDAALGNQEKGIVGIGIEGEVAIDDDLAGVRAVEAQSRLERFPLALLGESIRQTIPLKSDAGYANAKIDWSWEKQAWKASGNLELHDVIISAGKLSPDPISVAADFKLNPQLLILKKLNLKQVHGELSLTGQISGPLSESPSLDLAWEGAIGDRFLKPFVAPHVEAAGSVLLRGTAKGPVHDLSAEATANLQGVSLGISHYVQKKRDTAGTLALSARIRRHGESAASKTQAEASLSCRFANVQIGLHDQASLIPNAKIELETKIVADTRRLDVKDASLVLYGPERSQKILSASANVTAVGSTQEKMGIQIKTTLDKPTFNMLLKSFSPLLDLDGKTELVFKMSGTRDAFDWSINAPLSGMGIRSGTGFSKPAGTPASITAAGTWNRGEITLAKGEVSSSGLALMASGRLRDGKGSFHNLNVDIRKMDLADVSKLMTVKDFRISGSVDGQLRIGNSGQGFAPAGKVNLSNVTLSPQQQPGFMLANINGAVEIKGQTLRSDHLSGRVKGALDAPVKMHGILTNITSLETIHGNVFIQTGKGTLRADFLTPIISQTQQAIGRALAMGGLSNGERVFEVEGGSASLNIGGGLIQTQDLKIKGSAVALGAVGSYRLAENSLNSTVSVQTRLFENMPLGKIPAVQQILKQNEGWLKATGLDKELRKFGIKPPENQPGESPKPADEKIPPTTVLFKVQGSVRNPQVIPILESSLDKKTLELLKNLSQL